MAQQKVGYDSDRIDSLPGLRVSVPLGYLLHTRATQIASLERERETLKGQLADLLDEQKKLIGERDTSSFWISFSSRSRPASPLA